MIRFGAWLCSLVMLAGCGRYFDGPIQPAPQEQQEADMVIKDDGLITYSFERLEIGLRPMTDAELNRKFPQQSTQGARIDQSLYFRQLEAHGRRLDAAQTQRMAAKS